MVGCSSGSGIDELDAIIARSIALGREGLERENEALLRSALARYPDSAELCLRAALAIWDPRESTELLRRAVRLEPTDPATLTRAADVMFAFGEFDETAEWVRRARAYATDDFPLAAGLVNLAGRLASEQGDDARAERLLEHAFKLDRDVPGFGRSLADFYASRGRPVEALRVISEALQDHPDDEVLQRTRNRILAEFDTNP